MAIPFKNPEPPHPYKISTEKARITRLFTKREVPRSTPGAVLLATWNIANLGAQDRKPEALELIAHILKRFDLIAVQEVNDNFNALMTIMGHLGRRFDYVMTDPAGNDERLAYIYRRSRVEPTNLFGEIAFPARHHPKRKVRVRYQEDGQEKEQVFDNFKFAPFDRNPFIGSFQTGQVTFTLANCHLYYGRVQNSKTEEDRRKYARRVLEIVALAKWANGRFNKTTVFDPDIILLGDMNVPSMDEDEPTFRELVRFGWKPVEFSTKVGGTNLGNNKTYDQMAFAPGPLKNRTLAFGVFDFDNAIFTELWERCAAQFPKSQAVGKFNKHVKHHLSDHRPLWIQLDVT